MARMLFSRLRTIVQAVSTILQSQPRRGCTDVPTKVGRDLPNDRGSDDDGVFDTPLAGSEAARPRMASRKAVTPAPAPCFRSPTTSRRVLHDSLERVEQLCTAWNSVAELMRDIGRPRGDLWEVAIWEDALAADEREVYLTFQVHNEAIVVPETIDCIRALTGREQDGAASIRQTDRALGVVDEFLPGTRTGT